MEFRVEKKRGERERKAKKLDETFFFPKKKEPERQQRRLFLSLLSKLYPLALFQSKPGGVIKEDLFLF